ncbi:nucleobase-ascorbate transporter 4 [Lycium ferocissimum]|uniref:nucleobase-ascorbate transporter 4 n=1 Tax=Lycium ferocissimum TaxID=112874 RepID=UPI0028153702|nr:nucleobase-ascorbate transporter 4 [Lycium ferocissimum]
MTGPAKDEFVPHPVKDQLPGVDYCINSNPSWAEAVILGFQHYLVMLGTSVIIPTIIVPQMGGGNVEKAQVIQTLLFVSGVNTLLQSWFGTRLPVVIGGSFRFIVPAVFIALSNRYNTYLVPRERFKQSMRSMQGALMIASVLPILLGFLGIWRIVTRFLSPLSKAPLVLLVGIGLYEHGFPLLGECVEIGLQELMLLILLSQFIPHMWKLKLPIFERFAVLLSVGTVWAFAALLTVAGAYKNKPLQTQFSCRVDRSGLVGGSSWIRFPYPLQWGTPNVDVGQVFLMTAAVFVSHVESTGGFIAAARYGSATFCPASILSRGAGWLGIGMLLNGLWGTPCGSTVSVENVGLLALTRVGSRRVIQISAVFMLFFSVLGKVGAILASIPLPIIGALYCVLFGLMSAAGFDLLQFCNLNSHRTKFILGFSIYMGLSVPQYFNGSVITTGRSPVQSGSATIDLIMQVIFTSPATVAGIIAYFLDNTLARGHPLTRIDSGRHWWAKFKYFHRDPRSEEFYSLPYGLSKYFPSV